MAARWLGCVALLVALLATCGPASAQIELGVQNQWDLGAWYGHSGHVGVRAFVNLDADPELEVLFNLNRSADFVALEMDGTELWRSTQETNNSKEAYYPVISVDQGLLFYGSRATNRVYAVNITDNGPGDAAGSLAWSKKLSSASSVGYMSIELADVGVIAGHYQNGGATLLDFDGNEMPGWPNDFWQMEQLLGAGDLDGDGQDEFFQNSNGGQVRMYDRDGTELFRRQSNMTHNDYAVIADINQDPGNPNNLGAELLVALDDNGSRSDEGDEIVLLNQYGQEVARYETGATGVNYAVGDIRPDLPGLEVFYGNEGSNTIGLLDHRLTPIFTSSLTGVAANLGVPLNNAAGQTALADLDGDGVLELLINTGEDAASGILVFSAEGNFDSPGFDAEEILVDAIFGKGWDFDPQSIFSHADPASKRFLDVNGDGRDDIITSAVGANSGTGDQTVYLLGNIAPPDADAGDYNGDSLVDAADYAVWRNAFGVGGSGTLPFNETATLGQVTIEDYQVWRENYGRWYPKRPLIPLAAPEPAALLLFAVAAAFLMAPWRNVGKTIRVVHLRANHRMNTRFCFVLAILAIAPTTVAAQDDATTRIDLAGDWRFELDRDDAGIAQHWPTRELANRIELPGILQSQGYGDEISVDTPWVLGLGGEWWKLQAEELRSVFSQPGRVEVPFLSQPTRHYLGAAWYQRDIHVPDDWRGKRVELFLERPRWESTVWVDDREIGSMRSLVAPHEFDLGVLPPGEHRLTIRLDNRMIVSDPRGNNGHMPDAHAVSDALGSTWNGVAGKIELRATPRVWLADVQAYPNVADKSVRLKVQLGNATGEPGKGKLSVGGVAFDVDWTSDGGNAEVVVPLGDDAALWDEFHPEFQRLHVELVSLAGEHAREVAFGLREITWRGKDPLINGRVVNFRTTHFGDDFPLTGYPATDVESWKRIIRRCQEFGLNGIRFHSCCPPEAAFTAADELGFYLQAECGLWAPFYPDGAFTNYLEEETPLLLRAYGNHPSFVMFAPSNEPAGRYTQVTPQWAARQYERDPRRLYSAGTGWNRPEQVFGGAQVAGLVRFGKGELRNVTGWFGEDFRTALEGVEIPVLAHEIGQWCAYPDFDVIEKFTGYLRPSNYRIFRYIAERNGVAHLNKPFAYASGKFQLACYKEELEANLRTPGLAGHQMLDIRDYLGQGTALIGVLDAFWDPKDYVTAGEFRRFHSQTVPLARLKQRTFTTAETLAADVELYHFGATPLADASPYWKVVEADGNVIRDGAWESRDIPIGKNNPLGHVSVALRDLPAPAAYKLVVGLRGTRVENDWNFWLYPEAPAANEADQVLLTRDWQTAAARLAEGGTVVFTPDRDDLDPGRSPPMKRAPVFWNIQMTVRPPRNPRPRFDAMLGLLVDPAHPALAGFPTAEHCDWQWTSVINGVRSVNLTEAPQDFTPIVYAIDDWNRNWRLGVIFECRVGNGRLLVSAIPLDKRDPVTRQLRKSLLTYAAGDAALPLATLSPERADSLWRATENPADAPTERRFDPDLDDGTGRASRD